MSLKVFAFCLYLVLTSGQQLDGNPSSFATVKETVYDVNLYISVPAGVVAVGLLLCLCYCLIGSCRSPDMQPFPVVQPVIVTNRNSPLVVSAQSTSNNDSGAHAMSSTATTENNTVNTQTQPQNPLVGRKCSQKKAKTGPSVNQKSVGPKNNPTDQMKACENQSTQSSDVSTQSSPALVNTKPMSGPTPSTSQQSVVTPVTQRLAQNGKNSGIRAVSPSATTQSTVGTPMTDQQLIRQTRTVVPMIVKSPDKEGGPQ